MAPAVVVAVLLASRVATTTGQGTEAHMQSSPSEYHATHDCIDNDADVAAWPWYTSGSSVGGCADVVGRCFAPRTADANLSEGAAVRHSSCRTCEMVCTDIDYGATDIGGHGCSAFEGSFGDRYDDSDFTANEMCCASGGGSNPQDLHVFCEHDYFYASWGRCEECQYCEYCEDGYDGTCGECGWGHCQNRCVDHDALVSNALATLAGSVLGNHSWNCSDIAWACSENYYYSDLQQLAWSTCCATCAEECADKPGTRLDNWKIDCADFYSRFLEGRGLECANITDVGHRQRVEDHIVANCEQTCGLCTPSCEDNDAMAVARAHSFGYDIAGCHDYAVVTACWDTQYLCCASCHSYKNQEVCEDHDDLAVQIARVELGATIDGCSDLAFMCYDHRVKSVCCATCNKAPQECNDKDADVAAWVWYTKGSSVSGCADVARRCFVPRIPDVELSEGAAVRHSCCQTCEMVCVDTDDGATDIDGYSCSVYEGSSGARSDDSDFTANEMCCASGGGSDPQDLHLFCEHGYFYASSSRCEECQYCQYCGDGYDGTCGACGVSLYGGRCEAPPTPSPTRMRPMVVVQTILQGVDYELLVSRYEAYAAFETTIKVTLADLAGPSVSPDQVDVIVVQGSVVVTAQIAVPDSGAEGDQLAVSQSIQQTLQAADVSESIVESTRLAAASNAALQEAVQTDQLQATFWVQVVTGAPTAAPLPGLEADASTTTTPSAAPASAATATPTTAAPSSTAAHQDSAQATLASTTAEAEGVTSAAALPDAAVALALTFVAVGALA